MYVYNFTWFYNEHKGDWFVILFFDKICFCEKIKLMEWNLVKKITNISCFAVNFNYPN